MVEDYSGSDGELRDSDERAHRAEENELREEMLKRLSKKYIEELLIGDEDLFSQIAKKISGREPVQPRAQTKRRKNKDRFEANISQDEVGNLNKSSNAKVTQTDGLEYLFFFVLLENTSFYYRTFFPVHICTWASS